MAVSKDYLYMVKDALDPIGPISHKRMFGGIGVYAQDYIIALLMDDQLFFKTDAETRPLFEAEGMEPFSYAKKDGTVGVMTYFSAPEIVFDDGDEMVKWGRIALDASLRAPKKKK